MTDQWENEGGAVSDTKFLLRDARDQINLELRKVSRRISAEVYAEIEAEVLANNENFVNVRVDEKEIRRRLIEAIRGLD